MDGTTDTFTQQNTNTDTKVTNNTTTSTYYITESISSSSIIDTLVKRSAVYVNEDGDIVATNIPAAGLIWQTF